MSAAELIIVVGASPRGEEADRPLAYKLREAVVSWQRRHAHQLETDLTVRVCTDLWYLHDEDVRQRPSVCIGGPGVNALSNYLAQHLDGDHRQADVLMQIDPDHTDLRVVIWGKDHLRTTHGVNLFIERYLDDYLRAVVTQVEPAE